MRGRKGGEQMFEVKRIDTSGGGGEGANACGGEGICKNDD